MPGLRATLDVVAQNLEQRLRELAAQVRSANRNADGTGEERRRARLEERARKIRIAGRGPQSNALTDFAQRDEFVGRLGTIGRSVRASNLIGLAFGAVTVEELFQQLTKLSQGATFRQVVKDSVNRILPQVLVTALPQLLDTRLRQERLKTLEIFRQERERQLLSERLKSDFLFAASVSEQTARDFRQGEQDYIIERAQEAARIGLR